LCLLAVMVGVVFVDVARVSADSPMYHVVGWGDTLYSIANRYSTTVNAMMQANGIRNAEVIYVGQRLLVPGDYRPGPNGTTYVVQSGDTLFSIANRNSTTVSTLMQANDLRNYWIYIGQSLKIPGAWGPGPLPQGPLPPGQQPLQPLQPGQPRAGEQHGIYHIVRGGDYLSHIATRYKSSPYAIQIANKLPNASFLWTGQRLYIPDGQQPANDAPNSFNQLPEIYEPPMSNPPLVVGPSMGGGYPPVVYQTPSAAAAPGIPYPYSNSWEAVLITNTVGTGPCSLAAIVVGKNDWPVVVATPDGSWISDPKLTGTKPERGPYVVEFAHACTGLWRVIPLGLNIYADVQLNGGHAEVEFHPRYN
jgi:LysM repeat protein